ASAKKEARKTMANTNIYCATLSSNFLKNQLLISGKRKKTMATNMIDEIPSCTQNAEDTSSLAIPATPAKTSSAKISVIMVAPTVNVTDLLRATEYLLAIG